MSRFGLFKAGKFGFAISLPLIIKVLQGSRSYPLPRLPGAVAAVLVDDGQLIPLLDLERILGECSESGPSVRNYQVLVDSEYGTVALPACAAGRIVAEHKGARSSFTAEEKDFGIIGKFVYQNEDYNILDIDFLAIEMTQVFWQTKPDTGGARRHQ